MSVFQALTEGVKTDSRQLQESVAAKGARILQENKWAEKYSKLNAMFESADVKSRYIAGLTAQVMENLNTTLESAKANLGEATIGASLGNMAMLTPRVVDIVGIFYPNMISHLITDIQAIDRSTGEIFIIKPKYSNTAAGVTAGDQIFKTVTDGTYASELIKVNGGTPDGSTTTFAVTLTTPVRPSTVALYVDGAVVAKDNGIGQIAGNGVAGTVDYETGATSVTFDTAPAATDTMLFEAYVDSETNTSLIREVEFEIGAVPVTARAHPLKYKVSVQSQLIAQSHLNIDVNDVLTQEAAGLIKQERDIRMIDVINRSATHETDLDFSASMSGVNYPKKDKYGEIGLKVDIAGALINKRTGRGGVSFIATGINGAQLFKNVPGFKSAVEAAAPIGPYKVGSIMDDTVPVICVPNSTLGDNNYIVGFRGYQAGDSATVLAEWIPLYFTALWESPDLINQKGLMSMYDLFVNRSDYLVKGTVSGYAA